MPDEVNELAVVADDLEANPKSRPMWIMLKWIKLLCLQTAENTDAFLSGLMGEDGPDDPTDPGQRTSFKIGKGVAPGLKKIAAGVVDLLVIAAIGAIAKKVEDVT